MNKAYNGNRNSLLFVLVMCLVLFNGVFLLAGCGLDTFYYIEAPEVPSAHTIPNIDNSEILKQTFKFHTNISNTSDGGFSYVGTEVYYKIYNDINKFTSERNILQGKIDNKDYETAIYLIQNLKYQVLHFMNNSIHNELLIRNISDIDIRLTDSSLPEYKRNVTVNGTYVGVPVRINGKSFNFTKDNRPYKDENAADVQISDDNLGDFWYVSLYAVSRGHEQNYIPIYSDITYLGSVKIKQNTPN